MKVYLHMGHMSAYVPTRMYKINTLDCKSQNLRSTSVPMRMPSAQFHSFRMALLLGLFELQVRSLENRVAQESVGRLVSNL